MVNFVEAIEDGRIVKVTEDYAKSERLLIVRKQDDAASYGYTSPSLAPSGSSPTPAKSVVPASSFSIKRREAFTLDKMRRPLNYHKNNVSADLKDNFHWEISATRKKINMTRRQLAQKVGESEETIKMVENGMLPNDNYILINKIQSVLGINLRKDGKKYETPALHRTLAAAKTPRWAKPEEKPFVSDVPAEEPSEATVDPVDVDELIGVDIEVFDE